MALLTRLPYEASRQKGVIPTDVMSLYHRHKNMVYRLALSYTKSADDAEDICQSVFLRLMERGADICPGREKAWLATVTVNLCRDFLRSSWRRKTEPLTDELSFEAPEQGEIFEAVMALGEAERMAVYLHYFEGYSTAETAQILGITQTAVTTRLGRARKHLRNRLEAAI